MANETITIECLPDGSYRVTSTEDDSGDAGDQPLNQTVKSVDEVLQLVQRELSDDQGEADPKAAWDQEAAKRGPDGMPATGGAPAMSM
jgi:hypothetical protein